MSRFSAEYVDDLLARGGYTELTELSAIICGSPSLRRDNPGWGLPEIPFVFVETLFWFAQGMKSGVWTYYEATPVARQEAMLKAPYSATVSPMPGLLRATHQLAAQTFATKRHSEIRRSLAFQWIFPRRHAILPIPTWSEARSPSVCFSRQKPEKRGLLGRSGVRFPVFPRSCWYPLPDVIRLFTEKPDRSP